MATYAIGDVQGCFTCLQTLLKHICFNTNKDVLWFAGDIVSRGPKSLETLRYIKDLGDNALMVLGNHDLAFLATWAGHIAPKASSKLDTLLSAPDCNSLANWLRSRPLLHYDKQLNTALVHAGIPPQWSVETACKHAQEVEAVLQSNDANAFLANMFGDEPKNWSDDLSGNARLRYTVNALTRMRYIDNHGQLNLAAKSNPKHAPEDSMPWFMVPARQSKDTRVLFGHWAALKGQCDTPNVDALDTGCIWGGQLTALCLETNTRYAIECEGL